MKGLSHSTRCFLFLNSAFLLWGITPLFAELISISVNPLICLRCAIGTLALGAILRARGISCRLQSVADYALLGATGVMMGMHWVLYFHAIRLAGVAVATIALCTGPIITILLEPPLNGERFRMRDVITGCVVLAGIHVLVPHFNLGDQTTRGVLLGVLSAFLFSLRSIFSRRLLRRYDSTVVMFYQIFVTFLMLVPAVILAPPTFQGNDLVFLLVLGVVFTAIAHTLYIAGLRGLRAKTAGIVQPIVPVYSTFFAMWIIGEIPTLRTVLGGIIVLSSVVYETLVGFKE